MVLRKRKLLSKSSKANNLNALLGRFENENLPSIKNAKIDLGKLAFQWVDEGQAKGSISDFVSHKLATFLNGDNNQLAFSK